MTVPGIDHIVIDVGDRFDEAEQRYRALGFQPTPRARHSLGSLNQLFVFGSDYLEFLSPGTGARPDLVGFPVGLNGLVFALKGADAVHRELQRSRHSGAARAALFAQCRSAGRNAGRGAVQRDPARAAQRVRRPRLFLRARHARHDLAARMAGRIRTARSGSRALRLRRATRTALRRCSTACSTPALLRALRHKMTRMCCGPERSRSKSGRMMRLAADIGRRDAGPGRTRRSHGACRHPRALAGCNGRNVAGQWHPEFQSRARPYPRAGD